jgi:UDP-arabinose 4-epimerase
MSERLIKDWPVAYPALNGPTRVALLRYFNVVGSDAAGRVGEVPKISGANKNTRLSGACFDAAMGKIPQMKVYGTDWPTADGTTVRDYIHVTDLIDAHITVLASLTKEPYTLENPQIYNVGTGKGNSVREFLDAIMKVTGKEFKVEYKPRRPGDYAEIFANPNKIKEALGWSAKFTDLETSLATAWKWRQAHPDGYD